MQTLRPFYLLPAVAVAVVACSPLQTEPVEVEKPVVECPVIEAPPPCPEPEVIEKVVIKTVPAPLPPPQQAKTAGELHLPIVGAVEWVTLEPSELVLEARIDTGAETSAVHAEDIQLVERDGKKYVSFALVDPKSGEKVQLEERLKRKVLIKQSEGDNERRYVVKLWLTLGETRSQVEVTLSDREVFEYPLLVGRNFLTDTVIVDVSRHHTLTPPKAKP